MDISNLNNNYPLLLQYMYENQYNHKYIGFIRTEINWILTNNKDEWASLKDACEERVSLLKKLKKYKSSDNIINDVLELDEVLSCIEVYCSMFLSRMFEAIIGGTYDAGDELYPFW